MEVISTAGTLALAWALFFALIAYSWAVVTRRAANGGPFAHCIMAEAAERFRNEHERIRRRQAVFLASALVFVIAFTAFVLMPPGAFQDAASWQLGIVLAAVAGLAGFFLYRIAGSVVALRRLGYLRDASIAIGHGLQKIGGNLNRTFHDVPCGREIIDNVLVGVHGVCAVYVVARRPGRRKAVRLRGDRLAFAPGRHVLSVEPYLLRSERLAAWMGKALKHRVRVRTVIAVPGWEIEEQRSTDCLLVNEQNLVMIRGWKEPNDYLLNEDVEALHELLAARCTRKATARH